ncbi:MAG: DUF4331 family protein [Rhodothermaceae bacterium]|nr:DUF4331 family protein [Rhodothermaceae bacterium]
MHPTPLRFLRAGLVGVALLAVALGPVLLAPAPSDASSHREAPLIANDPLADNTDVYAFVSPDDPNTVTIIANYIPLELPEGGPNYSTFGENIRYEIHIKNQPSAAALGDAADDITYRFTFDQVNEDPTTFFNIRLGAQNLKTTYTAERSTDGGQTFQPIISNGIVPPNNIGPRSIEGSAGLNTTYDQLVQDAIMTASTGEKVFAGPRDDPFFVDLGGVFDLGGFRDDFGMDPNNPDNARDAVAGFNTHAIAIQVPISTLQKDGLGPDQADNILDPDFVIGVWASASRPRVRTLSDFGNPPVYSGDWVQVSRLGMPLTNEAVIPIGAKDAWNAVTPYSIEDSFAFTFFFAQPELALYMGNGAFGTAVPGLSSDLVIPTNSYPSIGDPDGDGQNGFNFTNTGNGLFDLVTGGVDVSGTAFDPNVAPLKPAGNGSNTALLGMNDPRRSDIYPIFHFGVPNLAPYQLATGKTGGPFSAGKPFINNFLPLTAATDGLYGGDMLRLNMAVPPTDRTSQEFQDFSHQGLIRAAVLGLTDPTYNTTTDLEFIPHMDGFPNGRRLEDDVTTIELQAVGGLVLAAVGVPFDDATAGDYSDLLSPNLLSALGFVAGPTKNDLPLGTTFPYMANPHRGYDYVKQLTAEPPPTPTALDPIGVGVPGGFILEQNYPNPFGPRSTIRYHVTRDNLVRLDVYDVRGRRIQTLVDAERPAGTHEVTWDGSRLASGTYLYRLSVGGDVVSTRQATVVR